LVTGNPNKLKELKAMAPANLELSSREVDLTEIQSLAAYYDGENLLFGHGVLRGTTVEPRGQNGFGFDPVVVPDG